MVTRPENDGHCSISLWNASRHPWQMGRPLRRLFQSLRTTGSAKVWQCPSSTDPYSQRSQIKWQQHIFLSPRVYPSRRQAHLSLAKLPPQIKVLNLLTDNYLYHNNLYICLHAICLLLASKLTPFYWYLTRAISYCYICFMYIAIVYLQNPLIKNAMSRGHQV